MSAIDSCYSIPDQDDWGKAIAFEVASYLTDPICKSHEFFRRLFVVEALNPTASKIEVWAQQFFLLCGSIVCFLLSPAFALAGIALRGMVSQIESYPFIHYRGEAQEKSLENGEFSLFSFNACCVGAGYAISDGGVVPWPFRIDEIAKKVRDQDADVTCLYEIFDIQTALILYEKMKDKYAHFYFNIGPRAVGISSGMFVASKFAIENPQFVAFSKEMLVGRTKNAEKGHFSFDLKTQGQSFATIITTHLQQSEECAYPTDEEKEARRQEMEMVMNKVDQVKDHAIVVTGDLNLDDDEYKNSAWRTRLQKGDQFGRQKTWGGDQFCAQMVGKQVSGPLNLDHTMIVAGSAQEIKTTLVEVGYNSAEFKQEALSDHLGLYSLIRV